MKIPQAIRTWLLLTLLSTPVLADYSQSELAHVAEQTTWLKLLKYEGEGNSQKSAVFSEGFFFADNGSTDPEAELAATLIAFSSPLQPAYDDKGELLEGLKGENVSKDQHPQCRFRGRYTWLKTQFDLSTIEEINCPAFEEWSADVDSISFILATGYLNNPASFYGHTLLKLNTRSENHTSSQSSNRLLDQSVNYGAIIPDGENPFVYIVKGISGFYEAGFTHKEFYYHDHNYGDGQLRDQWEYELDLSQEEVQLVTAHAWELLGRKYDYYFFTRNCAYRMAELFEVVDGVEFKPDRTFMLPQAFFQELSQARRNGEPLIREVYYHPSKQQILYNSYLNLNSDQQEITHELIATGDFRNNTDYQTQPTDKRQIITDTVMNYYQFAEVAVEGKRSSYEPTAPQYSAALKERFRLPVGTPELDTEIPAAPHNGRNPSLLRLSGKHLTSANKTGIQLLVRPAYYDALDAREGHVKNGQLAMGTIAASIYDDALRLDYFDLINISSVNNAVTYLPGDRGFAWKLRAGAIRQTESCDHCVIPRFSGSFGKARALFDQNMMIAGYVGGALQDNRNDAGYAYISAGADLLLHLAPVDIKLSSEARQHIDSDWADEYDHSAEFRFETSTNSELRIVGRHNRGSSISAGYGVYW